MRLQIYTNVVSFRSVSFAFVFYSVCVSVAENVSHSALVCMFLNIFSGCFIARCFCVYFYGAWRRLNELLFIVFSLSLSVCLCRW